jgi:hypothetical protein
VLNFGRVSASFQRIKPSQIKALLRLDNYKDGATTFSITTLSIMTLSITTLSRIALSIMTLSIIALRIMTLSIMTLAIICLFETISKNDKQLKDIQHNDT